MRMTRAALIATVLATAVLVAGCDHSSKFSSGTASSAASYAAAPAAAVPTPGATFAGDKAAPGTAAGATAEGAGAAGESPAALLQSVALIKTAELTVVTKKNVAGQAAQVYAIAKAAGGSVSSDVETAGMSADMTLSVTPGSLEAVLQQLDGLGTEKSRQTSTQDVTGQVADVTSRVASAQASIARLRTLFAKAVNVTDIVALENELSQREADLESLQAQQKALATETANATITLHLLGTPVTAAVHHHTTPRGFGGGLTHGWHAFTASVAWTLTGLGAGLPFLIVAALIGGAGLLIRRRLSGRPAAPAAATANLASSGPGVGE
jgi:hypothetical protein